MNAPIKAKAQFVWQDPLLLETQLAQEERMVRDAAHDYCQGKLAPRVLEAMLPYFSGERTPINDPYARGIIAGLSRFHTKAHLARATLEACNYRAITATNGAEAVAEDLDDEHQGGNEDDRPQKMLQVLPGTLRLHAVGVVGDERHQPQPQGHREMPGGRQETGHETEQISSTLANAAITGRPGAAPSLSLFRPERPRADRDQTESSDRVNLL